MNTCITLKTCFLFPPKLRGKNLFGEIMFELTLRTTIVLSSIVLLL